MFYKKYIHGQNVRCSYCCKKFWYSGNYFECSTF